MVWAFDYSVRTSAKKLRILVIASVSEAIPYTEDGMRSAECGMRITENGLRIQILLSGTGGILAA